MRPHAGVALALNYALATAHVPDWQRHKVHSSVRNAAESLVVVRGCGSGTGSIGAPSSLAFGSVTSVAGQRAHEF